MQICGCRQDGTPFCGAQHDDHGMLGLSLPLSLCRHIYIYTHTYKYGPDIYTYIHVYNYVYWGSPRLVCDKLKKT